jgi:hypothetical protein
VTIFNFEMSLYRQTRTKNQWKCYIAWISRLS